MHMHNFPLLKFVANFVGKVTSKGETSKKIHAFKNKLSFCIYTFCGFSILHASMNSSDKSSPEYTVSSVPFQFAFIISIETSCA